ncbi:MAG: polysaccharide biosynthesis/export family protein, partial [Desulfovibrio sp.]|nr:polysaccharide biosynthesis/export family protein [Desulfovibrio sp.]
MSLAFRLLAAVLILLWQAPVLAADAPRPFASNLFGGSFAKAPSQALCAPGDRIVLRIWGGEVSFDGTLAVGPDGTVDVPGIGPVPVAGLEHAKIADALKSKLLAMGDAASQIYLAPLDSRPVAVIVTGCVAKPGSYQGSPLDSVLAYLDKAGGVSPKGSYRDISLVRQG